MISKGNVKAQLEAAPLAILDGTHLIILPEKSSGECIVPAVPLKDVPNLVGRRYMSCFQDVDTPVCECNEETDVEQMQLDLLDIDEDLVRPVKLIKDGRTSSVRIWAGNRTSNVSMSWSVENTLDVRLVFADSSAQIPYVDPCDDKKVYGDNTNPWYDYESSSRTTAAKQCIEIQNASSCLVADFLGICGYQQVLVLPLLDEDVLSNLESEISSNKDPYERRGKLMKLILNRSFLTDGLGVMHSERLNDFDFEIRDDNFVVMTLPTLSLDDIAEDVTKCDAAKADLEPSSSMDEKAIDVESNYTHQENDNTVEDPPWLKTLQKTIEYRISKNQNEAAQIEKSNQMCQDLVSCGRNTVQKAARCSFDSDKNLLRESVQDPQVVRLRYGVQSRSSLDASGISAVMDLEVDIYLPEIQRDSKQLYGVLQSSFDSIAIRDFYISCLNDKTSSQNAQMDVSCRQIRTVSGIVPSLKPGECVTIMASVYFTNLEMSSPDVNTCSEINLSIQGYWVDGVSPSGAEHEGGQNRQGTVLCLLRLPEEMLYLAASNPTSMSGARCIHHEIHFVTNALDQKIFLPTGIFENREPRVVAVDISSTSNLQDTTIWKDLVGSLNDRIGMNSRIDLFLKKGDPQLRLIVFGSNLEEQTATTKILMQHLPESAMLISNNA